MRTSLLALLLAASVCAQDFSVERLGGFATGLYERAAAEIAAYDPATRRLFFVNAHVPVVEVLDVSNPAQPVPVSRIFIPAAYGKTANSVAIRNGIVAIAVEADPKTEPGYVVFYDTNATLLGAVRVGAQPDMVTFTPDGEYVLSANEGEPSDNYVTDPEGSVSIIDIRGGVRGLTQASVRTADFRQFVKAQLDPSIRIYGRNATVAQDLEPEYIAVSPDSKTAYVTLQENNAIGILNIAAGRFTRLVGLGFKDHSLPGNGLDPSDRDNAVRIGNWPVYGMYLPDAIAAFEAKGKTWLITANEGDAREWGDFVEEARVSSLKLDPTAFPNAATVQANANLGRLNVTTTLGDIDGDGDYDQLYTLGGRSFTIWSSEGKLVWDSGDQFEQYLAQRYPDHFNASSTNNTRDDRSDNKGPEPEGVVVAELNGRTYAFICLERIGGVMIYDVSDPEAPKFVNYTNHRDFSAPTNTVAAGDLAPEGILVVPAASSPNGKPMLVTANETSGTVSLFQMTPPPPAIAIQANIAPTDATTTVRQMTFDGSGSTGVGISYRWSVTGATAAVFPQAANTQRVNVQFAQGIATYTVNLTVTDTAGNESTTSRTVTYLGR